MPTQHSWLNSKGELVAMPLSPDEMLAVLKTVPSRPAAGGYKVTNLYVNADGKLVVEYEMED